MLLECQNCGAPLDITPNAWIAKCRYCGKTSRVTGLRTVAPETPRGWQPPPVWTPPAHFPAPSVPIQYHQRSIAAQLVGVAAALLVLGASAAVFLLSSSGEDYSSVRVQGIGPAPLPAEPALTKGQAWDGKSTLSCGMGETLDIEGKQVSFDGTLIDAAMSCTVRIKNSKLKGRTIVAAAMSANVEIENSTLDAELVVVDGAQAARVLASKGSRLTSADDGVRLAQGARLTLRDSSIDAKGIAVDLAMAAHLDASGGSISGKGGSISAASAAEVTLRGTKVAGKRRVAKNVRIDEK